MMMSLPAFVCKLGLLSLLWLALANAARTGRFAIGHRGYSAVAPENTMPAFVRAVEAGADGVEVDLQISKDGVIVLLHDSSLSRTSNCSGSISSYNFGPEPPSLQNCDFGSWFSPEFQNTKIPSLEELLVYAKANNLWIVLDMKQTGAGIGKMLQTLLDKYNMQHQCIASCWNDVQIKESVENLDKVPAQSLDSTLLAYTLNPVNFFNQKKEIGVEGFSVRYNSISANFVRDAHLRLLPVYAWTVNDPRDMRALLDMGVDGILTDRVDELIQVLDSFDTPLEVQYNQVVSLPGLISLTLLGFGVFVTIYVVATRRRENAAPAHYQKQLA